MKKLLRVIIAASLCSFGCSATKPVIDNSAQFNTHPKPYKVFSIGYWQPGYSVLTLTDAQNAYFTIKILKNDSLKIGGVYAAL